MRKAELILLAVMLCPVSVIGAQDRQPDTGSYADPWKDSGEFSVSYGFTRNSLLYQYVREIMIATSASSRKSYCYAVGYSKLTGSNISVSCSDGSQHDGDISADVIPVSLHWHNAVKKGFWRGTWGIGLTGYYYSGKIDMRPFDTVFDGSGLGFNLVIPGQLVVGINPRTGRFFRLNYEFQIPLSTNEYSAGPSFIETSTHQGIFLGLSLGQYW